MTNYKVKLDCRLAPFDDTILIATLVGPIDLVKKYVTIIEQIPDPDCVGAEAARLEAVEAVARYEMTRVLRFEMQESIKKGDRKKYNDQRKLLGDVLSSPMVSDKMWIDLDGGKMGAMPETTIGRSLLGHRDAILAIVQELRDTRAVIAGAIKGKQVMIDSLLDYCRRVK